MAILIRPLIWTERSLSKKLERREMAQDPEEFSQLWQRHLTVLRDDFSATSVQALPSQPSGSRTFDSEGADHAPEGISGHNWDENTGDALDELTL